MARRRFFVDQVLDGQAEIKGEEAHHLTRVLRVQTGEQYELTDTRRVWLAVVESVNKSVVRFRTLEELESVPALPDVTLYLAVIKFERFEWAVEKATELGVTRIVPVNAARSDAGLIEGAKKRVERWRRIAKESSEQSRRLRAPEITNPVPWTAAVQDIYSHRVWLDENDRTHPLMQTLTMRPGDSTALMIGPIGGWSDTERAGFANAGWKGASLGNSVLRVETAVCAAMAIFAQLAMVSALADGNRPTTIEAVHAV